MEQKNVNDDRGWFKKTNKQQSAPKAIIPPSRVTLA